MKFIPLALPSQGIPVLREKYGGGGVTLGAVDPEAMRPRLIGLLFL